MEIVQMFIRFGEHSLLKVLKKGFVMVGGQMDYKHLDNCYLPTGSMSPQYNNKNHKIFDFLKSQQRLSPIVCVFFYCYWRSLSTRL